jgi:hypothetical protein
VSAALIALSAVTFALGIAAGNGPRLAAAARGAATGWPTRRAPDPSPHLMEGITIMSADTTPGYRPDPGPDAGGEVVDLDAARAARPAPAGAGDGGRQDPPAPPAAAADDPGDDDGPAVLEGTVVPVDRPGDAPRDWHPPPDRPPVAAVAGRS